MKYLEMAGIGQLIQLTPRPMLVYPTRLGNGDYPIAHIVEYERLPYRNTRYGGSDTHFVHYHPALFFNAAD